MLKKVELTNVHSGRKTSILIDTGSDSKALIGAGKTSVETAQVKDVTGVDETVNPINFIQSSSGR